MHRTLQRQLFLMGNRVLSSQHLSRLPLMTSSVQCDDSLAIKTSAADPLPTSILKLFIDVIAPFIAELFNRSLATGEFPIVFKEAFITPVIKKPGLDVADPGSYRPISNLAVMSKLLERVVSAQLARYLEASNLLPPL
jgi:hypothetical protein